LAAEAAFAAELRSVAGVVTSNAGATLTADWDGGEGASTVVPELHPAMVTAATAVTKQVKIFIASQPSRQDYPEDISPAGAAYDQRRT
jgi:hypothetical protein